MKYSWCLPSLTQVQDHPDRDSVEMRVESSKPSRQRFSWDENWWFKTIQTKLQLIGELKVQNHSDRDSVVRCLFWKYIMAGISNNVVHILRLGNSQLTRWWRYNFNSSREQGSSRHYGCDVRLYTKTQGTSGIQTWCSYFLLILWLWPLHLKPTLLSFVISAYCTLWWCEKYVEILQREWNLHKFTPLSWENPKLKNLCSNL